MASTINATTSSGIVATADNTGQLALQANGTTVATAISTGFQINTYTPGASLITSGTAQATTSGTSVTFTGIPSWVKRITVMLNGVSTNGTSNIQIQIGSGSTTTSGYASQMWGSTAFSSVVSSGFVIFSPGAAANNFSGSVTLVLITSNTWVESGNLTYANANSAGWSSAGNSPNLAGALDRVVITTVNGTDTFDAGSINILYE